MSTTYELVRNQAALFDFSDEGRFFFPGNKAVEAVNGLISADLEAIPELKALNTAMLDEEGALIAILWVLKADDGVWVLCDPDRRNAVAARIDVAGIDFEDRRASTVCYAVIGPEAQNITMAVASDDILGIPYLGFEPNQETGALLSRLGYSGEFEYRFIIERAHADELRGKLETAGAEFGMGLGDTAVLPALMLEMRSLSQRDHVPAGTSAIEAGLHWMIDFQKASFPGRDAVLAQKTDPRRKALTLVLDTDQPPAAGTPVCIEGQEVGTCAYATVSPTIGKTIALAYIDAALAWVGVVFDIEGHDAPAKSAPLFITKTVSSGR